MVREMPLTGHLAELRSRLLVYGLTVVAGVIVSFIFRGFVFDLLLKPGDNPELFFHTLTGAIGPTMKMSLLGGLVLSLPMAIYQTVRFFGPGMTRSEKRYAVVLFPGVLICFGAGLSFAYFVLIPPIVHFLIEFGSDIGAEPLVSLDSYISTVVALLFWMGLGFETPFLMYFLSKIGVINPDFYSRNRKIWIVLSFVFGAIITPTFDPINQTMVAVPFIVLYEIGIWAAKIGVRNKPQVS